jgi:predicted deacetylase
MASQSAQYLIRFDDLCPTSSRERRELFLAIVARHGVRPILAVVPDNQDPDLKADQPDPEFWDRMRFLEAAGATIALHGYQHLCESSGQSLLGLHEKTEFAGVDEIRQREWIRTGLEILRGHGLCPRLFVAPRHGFDNATLRALFREGLGFLSDGFATRPFTRGEVVWIPQQLWEPVRKESGLWTICIHPNTAPESLERNLDSFLEECRNQFTTFDRVAAQSEPEQLGWAEWIAERMASRRIRLSFPRQKPVTA